MSEIPILPPMKISNSQPHQRRIDLVFQVLDQAKSQGINTYDDLIEFVREATGAGCSRKLISKWKKERAEAEAIAFSSTARSEPSPEPAVSNLQPTTATAAAPQEQLIQSRLSRLALFLRTPLKRLLLPAAAIGVGLAVVGQSLPSLSDRPMTTAAVNQATVPAAPSEGSANTPRTLKFSLSVSSPVDLKVKQGDAVEAGQVLAERREERDRLEAECNSLNLQYQQIQSRTIPKPPAPTVVPAVRTLPPISYAEEEAAIRAAETNVRQVERAFGLQQQSLRQAPLEESNAVERAAVEVEDKQRIVDNQKRKIDAAALLKDLPPSVLEHETEVLKAKVAELKQATADREQAQAHFETASRAQIEKLQQLGAQLEKSRADLQLAIAKLQTKKDQRAYQEYEASVTVARRAEEQNSAQERYSRNLLEAEQQERDRTFSLSQIKAKINDVNNQLVALSVVTRPYNGTVKAIKFQKQANSQLLVELTLTVGGSTAAAPSSSPQPSLPTTANPSQPY